MIAQLCLACDVRTAVHSNSLWLHLPSSSPSSSSCSIMSSPRKRGVLMVCLGNICRSPTAEAVFRQELVRRGMTDKWFVDSAGTSDWFTGELPERRARKILQSHGLKDEHEARSLTTQDFEDFDFILGMDYQNVKDIKNMKPDSSQAIIGMLGHYDPHDDSEIQDPYFRNDDKLYHICFERCLRAVSAFLEQHKNI